MSQISSFFPTGSKEERGLLSWRKNLLEESHSTSKRDLKIYEFPYITKYMRRVKCLSYVPILPTFDKEIHCGCCSREHEDDQKSKYAYENDLAIVEESNNKHHEPTYIPNGKDTQDDQTRM